MSPQQEKELTQLVTASWLGGIDPEIVAINIQAFYDQTLPLQKLHLEVIQVYQKLDERTLKQTHLEFFS